MEKTNDKRKRRIEINECKTEMKCLQLENVLFCIILNIFSNNFFNILKDYFTYFLTQ